MFGPKYLSGITFTNDIEKKKVKPLVPCYGGRNGKVHPCTDTEALYRPYGPQEEERYGSTHS
jgi:hypothetical protein